MLDIQVLRERPEEVKRALARRGEEAPIDRILELDAERRRLLGEVEGLRGNRNESSKAIGKMSDGAERQAAIEQTRGLGQAIETLDTALRSTEGQLHDLMLTIPNLPDPRVPEGLDERGNIVLRTVGEPAPLPFPALAHWDLGPRLGILDFERGVKITGSRFYILLEAGARLQRALIAWMLDLHRRQGYREVYPPFLVRRETLLAAGQLPKFEDNLYRDYAEDLWLVPTAEVPLTGLHMEEIVDGQELPLRYTAYTPCFRREKMSAGRDVRGIKRGHQFDKVEMYVFCEPEASDAELEQMIGHAEATCAGLGLAYRVLDHCAGDLGFSAQKAYDVEVWAPGVGEWLEVSSVSNCGDFQARRANARYRPAAKAGPRHLHTLNGSGLGVPRTLIAVLEAFQQPDGSVVIPEALRPWMGGEERIEAAK
ncbi:MAG: serine--tRNA ligase [Anaerolineales bacterium]